VIRSAIIDWPNCWRKKLRALVETAVSPTAPGANVRLWKAAFL
jgi:hypothetical protein